MEKVSFEYDLSQEGKVKGFVWLKEQSIHKGVVLICHGMAEHINRYDNFCRFLADNNYIVYGYDQRGHGSNVEDVKDIGYISDTNHFEILVSDVYEMVNHIKKNNPNIPIILFGHSLGSFISQRFIELYGTIINGVILSGTTMNNSFTINSGLVVTKIINRLKGRKYRSKFVHNLSIGSYNKKFKPNRTPSDWLSKNEDIVDEYNSDKYCGGIFPASYYMDLLEGFKNINKNIEIIPKDLPIYMFSGEKDPVGAMGKNVTKLYNKYKVSGIKSVTLKLYKDGRHEMLNELNKEDVYNDVLEWLNSNFK